MTEEATRAAGFPSGFPPTSPAGADLNSLASLYANSNFGPGMLPYGISSWFSRFYPGAENANTAADAAGLSTAALPPLSSWPTSPFNFPVPPPPGTTRPLPSTPTTAAAATSTPNNLTTNTTSSLNPFASSLVSPFPFFPNFGAPPLDFKQRLPGAMNNENFNLKNFDPQLMLSACFGALGNPAAAALDNGSGNNNLFGNTFPPLGNPASVSSSSAQPISTPNANSVSPSPVATASSAGGASTTPSKNNSSPLMSVADSKTSPLSLSSLNAELEQGRDLLQLHETLNQRFKVNSSGTNFNHRYFPYGFRPLLFNNGQYGNGKYGGGSLAPNEGKLFSPGSESSSTGGGGGGGSKRLQSSTSRTSSNCGSPAQSPGSGSSTKGSESEHCSSPGSMTGDNDHHRSPKRAVSPASSVDRNTKSTPKIKCPTKESIEELKNMQRMVEGLEASRSSSVPTIAAT